MKVLSEYTDNDALYWRIMHLQRSGEEIITLIGLF